ncbi:MAG TPA: MOSC domain-containing protein [Solirubrobacterales bacterium]|nr:MOSC domain-containing protein [Solirubrobacterales bacterium]
MATSPPIPRVLSTNVAEMRLIVLGGQPTKTGIYKHPVEGPQLVHDHQLGDDRQGDYSVHGGEHKAVYAYSRQDYEWWESELGRELEPGTFGENLTVVGIDASEALVGERWRIGTTLLEVSEPRVPCSKLAYRMEDPKFVKRFARALRPGAYLRIIEEGELETGQEIEVVERPGHDVSMRMISRAFFGERELIDRILTAERLSGQWRADLTRRRGGS